jgi:Bacterial dnaA protein helix-turn-helix
MTSFGVRSSLRSAAARRIEAAGIAFEERQRREQSAAAAQPEPRGSGSQASPSPGTTAPTPALPPEPARHFPFSALVEAPTDQPFEADRRPGMCRAIIAEVAAKYDVPVKDILSDRRAKVLIPPRHEAMYRCVAETPLSLPAIGRIFHRDHTSIGHGVMRHHLRTGDPLPRGMDWQAGRKSRARDFRTQGTDPGNTRDRRKRR